jgi:hypothetical protein
LVGHGNVNANGSSVSLCDNSGWRAARCSGQQLRVHAQRFAFRAPQEDDESVKMSNTTSRRASAIIPAHLAAHLWLKRAQNSNFYSIQTSGFLHRRILQSTENKALHFFYSTQMKSHHSLLTNPQSLPNKTRRIP